MKLGPENKGYGNIGQYGMRQNSFNADAEAPQTDPGAGSYGGQPDFLD